jgi:hypothetical protein
MSKKLDDIIRAAMELSLEERAQLAGTLLFSLDEPSESEVERLWLQEAERWLQDFREARLKESRRKRFSAAPSPTSHDCQVSSLIPWPQPVLIPIIQFRKSVILPYEER